jgi:hypothetical protein
MATNQPNRTSLSRSDNWNSRLDRRVLYYGVRFGVFRNIGAVVLTSNVTVKHPVTKAAVRLPTSFRRSAGMPIAVVYRELAIV